MSKEIYISSTPHETRLAIVENEALTEMYYERENEYTLAGSIYNGRVTRVLPGMQSAFVDIGLERDAFLYITDFMEEAGDAADFEAAANGGGESVRGGNDQARAPRTLEGERPERGDRGGRHDRGVREDRGSREARPAAEPTDAELFEQAVSGLGAPRPAGDGERSGGGSRRGGRNRRGGGYQDGQPRRERQDARQDLPAEPPAPLLAAPVIPLDGEQTGELGEGAPGADGSRRWRGRRGRRGNRGGREQAVRPVAGEPVEAGAPLQTRDEFEPDSYEPQAAAPRSFASAASVMPGEPVELHAAAAGQEPAYEEPRDRTRRDRGPRLERGAHTAPVYNAYPDNAYPDLNETAPAEPVILPGESLSKYRAGGAPEAAAAAADKPVAAPEFVLPAAWDGGAVLPGETLRRREPAAADSGREPRRDGGRAGRGFEDRGRREERGPRPERRFEQAAPPQSEAMPSANLTYTEPAATPVEEQHHAPAAPVDAPAAPVALAPDDLSSSHLVTPLNTTFVPPPPIPAAAPASFEAAGVYGIPILHEEPILSEEPAVSEASATPAVGPEAEREYEPTEAAVSYRVDPVAPSEYRQAAPAIEEVKSVVVDESDPEPSMHAGSVHENPLDRHAPRDPEPAEAHDVTSISAAGEMHSEPFAPVAHEAAALGKDETVKPATPAATPGQFEPGDGFLEEEVIEDDEDAVVTLHAGAHPAAAEYEADEQETLEGAADLGSMLREMSIDQITRVEPAEADDEEDFLDEDFSEEDLAADPYASDDLEDEPGDAAEESFAGEEEFAEPAAYAESAEQPAADGAAREPRREGERPREDRGRRDGRRNDRNRRGGGESRGFTSSGADRTGNERTGGGDRGRQNGRGGRQSMQMTNLPAISELLKPGQEILCQIAKEPIAKKGARITSHIALPGRFLVFMPTVNHTGVSRKIESDGERRRLKEILLSEKGDAQGGFIVRTAAAGASEEELRSDLRFLLNLWAGIKQRSESSKSPALIYHDLNLVERVLRDQVTDNFSAIWVDTETEYERVLRFLERFQPALMRRVKLYTKETPMYEQFGITEEINKALRSKVWLKSGGSIVINQTEALVAIDINTGKFVGKTARLEDTIVKTNLDAIPEIVRQIRLRDLGGIIIIDFIDMDERKNRNKVMAALEDELKTDRAPSKVLPFNDFGLVAITRKRVKQSLERTLSTTCGVCAGTGMVKSPVTVANDIYIEMRKMHKHLDRGDVMLRVHPDVVKQLKSGTSRWLQEMEEMVGKTILVKSDPSLHPEQFDIH